MDVHLIQGSTNKPLISLAILVIFTMLLTCTNTAPNLRHHRHQNNPHRQQLHDIRKSLCYSKGNFDRTIGKIFDLQISHTVDWVPKMRLIRFNVTGMTRRRKYRFLMPKLYRYLSKFHIIFENLRNVEKVITSSFDPLERDHKIGAIMRDIELTMSSVEEFMNKAKIKLNLSKFSNDVELVNFKHVVNRTECDMQDNVAYKAYYTTIRKWLKVLCFKKICKCGT